MKCKDHLGNEFKSIAEMCRHWGVKFPTVMSRLNRGYSLEEALLGKPTEKSKGVQLSPDEETLLRKKLDSERAESYRYYDAILGNVDRDTKIGTSPFNGGCKNGVSLKDFLVSSFSSYEKCYTRWHITKGSYNKCIKGGEFTENMLDSLLFEGLSGETYRGLEYLCRGYGVDSRRFIENLMLGLHFETAFISAASPKFMTRDDSIIIMDTLIKKRYDNIYKMCNFWGISAKQYLSTVSKLGSDGSIDLNLFDCLIDLHGIPKCIFVKRMSKYLGITEDALAMRLSNEERLSYIASDIQSLRLFCMDGCMVKDHLGSKFKSVKEMCKHWGISEGLFNKRCKYGYSLRASLTGEGVKDEFK